MCLTGAKSDTAKQLKETLCLNQLSDDEVLNLFSEFSRELKDLGFGALLKTANKIYPHINFAVKEDFNSILGKHFESETHALDFNNKAESAKVINDWIAEQTGDKIKDMLSEGSIDDLTKLILVNAIYFKAEWAKKFDKEQTKEDDFITKSGPVKVDMMKVNSGHFNVKVNPNGLKATTIELPYSGYKSAMTIVLPDEGVDLQEVENSLSGSLKEVLKQDFSTKYLNVYLPKFKLEFEAEVFFILFSFLSCLFIFDFFKYRSLRI